MQLGCIMIPHLTKAMVTSMNVSPCGSYHQGNLVFFHNLYFWGDYRGLGGNVSIKRCQQKAKEERALKDLVNEDKKFEKKPQI